MKFISSFIKYVLFFFNVAVTICGFILILVGTIYIVNNKGQASGIEVFNCNISAGGIIIAVGCVIFIISTLGCCGAIKQNICLLTTYAITLLILFAAQVVFGILALVTLNDFKLFYDHILEQIQSLFDDGSASALTNIDKIQENFKCCGVYNYTIYEHYPSSCCENVSNLCLSPYEIGCVDAVINYIIDNLQLIGYVAIGLAAVELIVAIFAFLVRRKAASANDAPGSELY